MLPGFKGRRGRFTGAIVSSTYPEVQAFCLNSHNTTFSNEERTPWLRFIHGNFSEARNYLYSELLAFQALPIVLYSKN
jgi:hypothetical protein